MTIPDKWLLIHINSSLYKVFGMWYGGYLSGDEWRLNSGVTSVEEYSDYYLFHGKSGSIYKCYKNNYGTNIYGQKVLNSFIEKIKNTDNTLEIIPNCEIDTLINDLIKNA